MAAGQVDDRQPAEPQRGMIVAVDARVVRPAVDDPVHHGLEEFRRRAHSWIGPDRAADAAHADSPQRYGRDGKARPKKHITAAATRFVRTFPGNATIRFAPSVLLFRMRQPPKCIGAVGPTRNRADSYGEKSAAQTVIETGSMGEIRSVERVSQG